MWVKEAFSKKHIRLVLVVCCVHVLAISTALAANKEYRRENTTNTHLLIFVHGFTGHYIDTWENFPDLIIDDSSLQHYDVLMWGYPSNKLARNPSIGNVGEHLRTELDQLPERYTHIVLAAHSMGGLVVRAAVISALTDGKRNDLTHIKQIVLYGTPNEGITSADYVPGIFNKQISDMKTASEFIIELRTEWLERVYRADSFTDEYHLAIPTTAVAGLLDQFVPYNSVRTFFEETEATDGNHVSMVKPASPEHLSFKILSEKMLAEAKDYAIDDKTAIGTIVEFLTKQIVEKDKLIEDQSQTIKGLTAAVTAVAEEQKSDNESEEADAALDSLVAGKTGKAETLLQARIDSGDLSPKQKAKYYRHIGEFAYLHDTNKALNAYRRAIDLDPYNSDGIARFGQLLQRQGDINGAEQAYEKLYALGNGADRQTALAAGSFGNLYNSQGAYKKALEKYEEARAIHEALGHKAGVANATGNIAIVRQKQGKFAMALERHERALELFRELGNKDGEANSYNNIGLIYLKRGRLEKALEMLEEALDINQAQGRKEAEANSYINIGSVYQSLDLQEEALGHYSKALDISKELDYKLGIAQSYGSIANIHFIREEFSQALEFYDLSLSKNKELNNKEAIASDYANIGLVYRDKGDLLKARSNWSKALILFQELASPGTVTIEKWLQDLETQ